MTPFRLTALFFCLLLGLGNSFAAVSTSDLAGTWSGTMSASTSNPITFTCNASGTITSGQEILSDGTAVQVSGDLAVGAGGAVSGTMTFTFPGGGGSVSATSRNVTMTILTSPSRLRMQGEMNAPYQPGGTDNLDVIREEPYIPPEPDVAVSRGGINISLNSTDAFPYVGVVAVPELLTYSLSNTGSLPLTVGSVTVSQQVHCTCSVNSAPASNIAPGGTSQLVLSVTPTSAGAWSCRISFATNDPDENPYAWTISGSATSSPEPELEIRRDGTTIGNGANDVLQNSVRPGRDSVISYTINNFGSDTLNIGTVNAADFNNCTVHVQVSASAISARATSALNVTINPTDKGPWSFTISVPSNDNSEPTTLWTLSGVSRDEVIVKNQNNCGLGGGFTVLALVFVFLGMCFLTNRSRSHKSSFVVCTTALAGLLVSASRISASEWNSDITRDYGILPDTTPVNDVRIGYTMLPTRVDVTFKDTSAGGYNAIYDFETNWDISGRIGVMWITPWSGSSLEADYFLGVEVSTNHSVMEANENSAEFEMRSYQFTLHPGMWFKMTDRLHIEANPFMSLGYGEIDHTTLGTGSDLYYDFGFRVAGYYTWRSGFQLGLQSGFIYGTTKSDISGNGSNYEGEIRYQGVFLGAQLGYRL